jgi:hypothetical protein
VQPTLPGQIGKIAARAVVTVDPDGARRRREETERVERHTADARLAPVDDD